MNEQKPWPLPGHYFTESYGAEPCGPYATAEEATAKARAVIEIEWLDPASFTLFCVSEVTVLPESLPRGGE